MKFAIALQNAQSVTDVVRIINDRFNYYGDRSPETLAAEYAVMSWDRDYDLAGQIDAHLEALIEAGAVFGFDEARKAAIDLCVCDIVQKIKKINQEQGHPISEDIENRSIREILFDYKVEDSEDCIANVFGVQGLHDIRDAEQGFAK